MNTVQKGNAEEQSSETRSRNEQLEKEQNRRKLLQEQEMLSQKQKYNAENNNNNKPQYAAIIENQAPEKSNQAAQNLKGLDNNKDFQDISRITNNNNNRGGNHSQQPSLTSNNVSVLQQVASIPPMQQQQQVNQGRAPANPNNKSHEEDAAIKGANQFYEEQQDAQQTFQKRDQIQLNSQAPQNNYQQSFQQQQQFQKQTAFTLGNDESYNQQQQQLLLGNGNINNQQFGFNQLTKEQQAMLLAQQQANNNNNNIGLNSQQQMNFYDQSAMNNNNNNNSLGNNFSDLNQLQQVLDEMFTTPVGQKALESNQHFLKILSEREEATRDKLNKQLLESQLKFLKNNNPNEAKAALNLKDEEIKRLNGIVNQLKEQIKGKLNEIEVWRSQAQLLKKNASTNSSNNNNAQTGNNNNNNNTDLTSNQIQVYQQEIQKLSLLIFTQQKEIEDLKSKAAANVDGSEKIAQQRVILLNVEIERLQNIIESMKGNNNLSDSKTNAINGADNNNGIKRRSIFTDNTSKPFNSIRSNAGRENTNNNQPESSDISNLRRLLESKISEVDEWRMKFAKLAEQAEERDELEAEVFRLKTALEETLLTRQNQFDNHIQARSQQHFERDSDKVAMLQVELEKLALALREKIAENETLKTQQIQLGQSMRANAANNQVVSSEVQGRNKELAGELQRATEMLREKVRQNDELRSQMNRLEGMLKDKQAENGQIAQRLQFAQGAIAEKQQAVNKIQQADTALKTMRDELEKAQNMLREKMRENESLRQNLQRAMNSNASREMIDQEMKKYQQALDMKSRECEEWKMRCRGIEQKLQQAAQVEARAKDSENRLRNLMQEIQMLPQKITKF